MESGARREKCHTGLSLNPHLWPPTGRDPNKKTISAPDPQPAGTLPPQQENEKIPPGLVTAQQMGDHHVSANEKPLYFRLSVSSKGLCIYNSPSWVHRRAFLSLAFGPVHGWPLDHMPWTTILCCYLMNLCCWSSTNYFSKLGWLLKLQLSQSYSVL